MVNEILGPKRIEAWAMKVNERQRAWLEAMTAQEQRALEALHEGDEDFFHTETDDIYDVASILDGSKTIDISHSGGELHDLARDLFNNAKNIGNEAIQRHRMDYQTCHDHAQRRTDAFVRQMPELVRAYLEWSTANAVREVQLYVVGIFCAERHALYVPTEDYSVPSALVHQGVIPCAPLHPHTAVMMDALELYRIARNCSPHFSIQAFVKTVSDLQGVQYHPYLAHLFSIALDVYLQIHLRVNDLVLEALCRDTPDWHLKNTCPTCTYTLKDKPDLKFKMLFAMDGNDSLKRISREAIGADKSAAQGLGERYIGDDCYLSWSFIDQFGVGCGDESLSEPMTDSSNPCTGRWKNMKEDVTSRMWGIFDEAGIFIAICRHGFSLLITDIVRSGERAKYPLAIVSKLLDIFGNNLAGGYDIGSIARYVAHNDKHDVYQNLTTMIFNNYKQALWIIEEGKKTLPRIMDDLGIMDVSVFQKPEEETLQMEYWQKLVNMDASQKHLSDLTWTVATLSSTATSSFVQKDIAVTTHKEMMRCHATENFEKDLKIVQDLEVRLGITKCWVPEDEEWQAAGRLVANHKYQCCLDQLESLVVAQIFELSKMNQAGTGYKLCKHIAKALKACSAAIRTALDWFNTAARTCSPPHPQLTFKEVVEYTFLADFDLLRNATREDISQRLWAAPAAHAAMDQYFKVCRVEEEIKCLMVEVHRTITYLHDEAHYVKACIAQLQVSHPPLAYQVQLHYNVRAKFTNHHLCLLTEIAHLPGFTGTILPGKSMKTNPSDSASEPTTIIPSVLSITTASPSPPASPDSVGGDENLDELDGDGDEYEDDKSALTLQDIIHISSDRCVVQEEY
ncbi:hypothetical protein PISMIDRAFT_18389 [Pisolithus microcarpus 441]|uniref:Unplaced genomic scaffold scaffold_354, whole genome shotgun sequence n=1 Tax=Pisolithus microcarpus 441 TaxID=765257 RepID=A0A0C9XKR4_9AGAM|nr:hypothetical protein PISMIDRAFT_18389 [Pisolithus microcarpus 441]